MREMDMGGLQFKTSLGNHNFSETLSLKKKTCCGWWYTSVMPASIRGKDRRITVQGQPQAKIETLSEK
jgi:hypothetical protein